MLLVSCSSEEQISKQNAHAKTDEESKTSVVNSKNDLDEKHVPFDDKNFKNIQRKNQNNQEEIKQEEIKQEEIKQEEIKQEEIKQEEIKQEDNTSSVKTGEMEFFSNIEIRFSGLSPVFQSYFYDQNAQDSYITFLQKEPIPDVKNLPVYVRWDDLQHNMGKGEICVYSSKKISDYDHILAYSRALYAYRTYLGSYFDVRLMSFSMCIEMEKCRFEVLERSDVSGISSCITILPDTESGVLRPSQSLLEGRRICTSAAESEERNKTPIQYSSFTEQFSEIWPQVKDCFVESR